VVRFPAFCSGDFGFRSWPGDQLSILRLFVIFLSPSRKIPGLLAQIRPKTASVHVLDNSLASSHPSSQHHIVIATDNYVEYTTNKIGEKTLAILFGIDGCIVI
jgi:hypothetical protein